MVPPPISPGSFLWGSASDSLVLLFELAQVQRRPAVNTSRVIFAVIMLRKITDLAANLIGDDLCLWFRFGALGLHFEFSFPDEEPTDRSQAFLCRLVQLPSATGTPGTTEPPRPSRSRQHAASRFDTDGNSAPRKPCGLQLILAVPLLQDPPRNSGCSDEPATEQIRAAGS
jgi:hypothetical protein